MKHTIRGLLVVAVLAWWVVPLQTQTPTPTPTPQTNPNAVQVEISPAAKPLPVSVQLTPSEQNAQPEGWPAQAMWALAISYLLQWMKNSKAVPFITPESTRRAQAQIGFLAALLTAAGVHLAINGSFFSHDGVGITLTGVSFDAVRDIGFQWASQQGWYDLVVSKRLPPTV